MSPMNCVAIQNWAIESRKVVLPKTQFAEAHPETRTLEGKLKFTVFAADSKRVITNKSK